MTQSLAELGEIFNNLPSPPHFCRRWCRTLCSRSTPARVHALAPRGRARQLPRRLPRGPGAHPQDARRGHAAGADAGGDVEPRLSTEFEAGLRELQRVQQQRSQSVQHPDAAAAAARRITEGAGAGPPGERGHIERGSRRGEGAGDMQDSSGDH
jgi:hypothetical protein